MTPLVALLLVSACDPIDPIDPIDDPETDDDDTPLPEWDSAPPDVAIGTLIKADLHCGLFDVPLPKVWELRADGWGEAELPGGSAPEPRSEVWDCFGIGDKTFDWSEDGGIFFSAAGWDHDLEPAGPELTWLGTGMPAEKPNGDCAEGLEELGLDLPITLQLQVEEIRLPE